MPAIADGEPVPANVGTHKPEPKNALMQRAVPNDYLINKTPAFCSAYL